jgi:hypothetical protein
MCDYENNILSGKGKKKLANSDGEFEWLLTGGV